MKTLDIQRAHLFEVLHYDSESGIFMWKARSGSRAAGKRAGSICKDTGRRVIQVNGNRVRASRLAWFYVYGAWPEGELDHADCNVLNDAISNLRDCTRTQNAGNIRRPKSNTSGFKGVSLIKSSGKYRATIKINRKSVWLGSFHDPRKAHEAYVAKARELFGEFARAA